MRQRPQRQCFGAQAGADFVCTSVVAGAGPILASSGVGQRALWRHACEFFVLPRPRGVASRLGVGGAGALACWARACGALPRRCIQVHALDTAGMPGDRLSTGKTIGGCCQIGRTTGGGKKRWSNVPSPCALGIFRRPEQCGHEGDPTPEKIPPSRGSAHRRRPTGVTVDRRPRLCRCRVVRVTSEKGLGPRWLEKFRVGCEWPWGGGSWGGNTAAVGGEHM
jgi:hypothetical protein